MRRATPPHNLIFNIKKSDLRNFGTADLAIRVLRQPDGKWAVVPSGRDVGYILFLKGSLPDIEHLPNELRVQVTDTQRYVGKVTVL